MSELTPQLSQELQYKFLYHLWMLIEERKNNNVNISEIWKRMNVDSSKESLLPTIVDILKEYGHIKEGETPKDVRLIYKKKEKKRLYILDLLNNIVNENEESLVGVTLTIGGAIITGNLISNRKYYTLFFEAMKSSMPEKEHRHLANAFNTIDEQIPTTEEEKEVMNKILGRDTICLENIRYFIGNTQVNINNKTTVWIGKIEEVDGFMLGILDLNIT